MTPTVGNILFSKVMLCMISTNFVPKRTCPYTMKHSLDFSYTGVFYPGYYLYPTVLLFL